MRLWEEDNANYEIIVICNIHLYETLRQRLFSKEYFIYSNKN